MTHHPITPPPKLVQQWMRVNNMDIAPFHLAQALATQAARWGFEQGVEACCEWLEKGPYGFSIAASASDLTGSLRAAVIPKPPSLKELALAAQQRMWDGSSTHADWELIRRALETLDD